MRNKRLEKSHEEAVQKSIRLCFGWLVFSQIRRVKYGDVKLSSVQGVEF